MTPGTGGTAGAAGTAGAWPRTAKLDAPALVERIADITGVRLVLEGPSPGGEVGAAFVRWPDGRRSVLGEGHSRTGPLLDLARAAGIPTARQELSAHIDGRRIVVQQRLPGVPPATVDAGLVRQMLDLNARFADLFAGHPPAPPVDLFLTRDGPGFCLHGPLAAHSPRTARLLARVREIGATAVPISGDDLMHLDFHPGNVLVDAGRISGVVDFDGATRGDRLFDLVTLRFDLTRRAPHLTPLVDERLAGADPGRLRAYWAHMSLRMVDWMIRHHGDGEVDAWSAVAESGPYR